jgi:four helix bundle protein
LTISKFEDIISWQKAKELTIDLYKIFDNIKYFNFRNQILRASVSIMNNIAEGFERQTNNEFRQFLYIAKGSAGELRNMLHLAHELNYIRKEQYELLHEQAITISKLISGLIKTL